MGLGLQAMGLIRASFIPICLVQRNGRQTEAGALVIHDHIILVHLDVAHGAGEDELLAVDLDDLGLGGGLHGLLHTHILSALDGDIAELLGGGVEHGLGGHGVGVRGHGFAGGIGAGGGVDFDGGVIEALGSGAHLIAVGIGFHIDALVAAVDLLHLDGDGIASVIDIRLNVGGTLCLDGLGLLGSHHILKGLVGFGGLHLLDIGGGDLGHLVVSLAVNDDFLDHGLNLADRIAVGVGNVLGAGFHAVGQGDLLRAGAVQTIGFAVLGIARNGIGFAGDLLHGHGGDHFVADQLAALIILRNMGHNGGFGADLHAVFNHIFLYAFGAGCGILGIDVDVFIHQLLQTDQHRYRLGILTGFHLDGDGAVAVQRILAAEVDVLALGVAGGDGLGGGILPDHIAFLPFAVAGIAVVRTFDLGPVALLLGRIDVGTGGVGVGHGLVDHDLTRGLGGDGIRLVLGRGFLALGLDGGAAVGIPGADFRFGTLGLHFGIIAALAPLGTLGGSGVAVLVGPCHGVAGGHITVGGAVGQNVRALDGVHAFGQFRCGSADAEQAQAHAHRQNHCHQFLQFLFHLSYLLNQSVVYSMIYIRSIRERIPPAVFRPLPRSMRCPSAKSIPVHCGMSVRIVPPARKSCPASWCAAGRGS